MIAALRLGIAGSERGVAHIAEWCGNGEWRARCNGIERSTWADGHEYPTMLESPSWRHRDGRLVTLSWEPDLSIPVCRRCIARARWDAAELAAWLEQRGIVL